MRWSNPAKSSKYPGASDRFGRHLWVQRVNSLSIVWKSWLRLAILRWKKLNCPSNTSNISLTTWSASQHFNSEPAWRFISPTSSSKQTVAPFANRTCRFQFVRRYYCHVCNSWLVIPNIQNCWEYLQLVFHSLSYTRRMYCYRSSIIVDVLLMINNHLLLITSIYIYICVLLMYYWCASII